MAVMTDKTEDTMSVSQEIEMLLPWYATGRLSDTERERVERYLETHPETAAQLSLIGEETEAAVDVNERIEVPGAGALDRLLARIDSEDGPAIRRAAAPGLMERLFALFPGLATPAVRYAAIGAALLIVVQAAVIGSLLEAPAPGTGYQTASGPGTEAVVETGRLLVAFADQATAAQIAGLLNDIDAEIVAGPKAGGFYELSVADTRPGDARLDGLLERLKQNTDIVKFASISG